MRLLVLSVILVSSSAMGGALAPALSAGSASLRDVSITPRLEKEGGRVVLRTPLGSFYTLADEMPPQLLEATLGGGDGATFALDASVSPRR